MASAIRPADISRYLGNNSRFSGVERSVHKAGTGRNKPSFSAGYEVKGFTEGTVSVRYTGGSHQGGSPAFRAKKYRAALDGLKKVLEWEYVLEDMGSYLKVTDRKVKAAPELTAQAVSAHLGRASKETGIKRSEYSSTRIRGWGRWTEGYEVKKTYLGITVEFNWASVHYSASSDADRRAAKLEKLKTALESKYKVEYGERGMGSKVLVVTAK